MAPQGIVVDEVTAVTPEVLDALRTLVPELSTSAPPLTETVLEEIVRSPATVLLVARDDTSGTVLGSLTLVVFTAPTGPRAWIEDVVVAPQARSRGVGAALVVEANARAAAAGIAYRGPHIPPVTRSSEPAVRTPRFRPAPDQRLPEDPRLTTRWAEDPTPARTWAPGLRTRGQAMVAVISSTMARVVPGWRNANRATVSPSHDVGVTNPICWARRRTDQAA